LINMPSSTYSRLHLSCLIRPSHQLFLPTVAPQSGASTRVPMLALISDIHSNLEALNAVFAEIDRRGITDVVCLGDIIGYGPNPMECLDIVADRCRILLMGNHDFAVFYEPFNSNSGTKQACFWT